MAEALDPKGLDAAVIAYDEERCRTHGPNEKPMSERNRETITPMIEAAVLAYVSYRCEICGQQLAWCHDHKPEAEIRREDGLSHDDLCRLSRVFGHEADLTIYSRDYRINEWLKRQIALALSDQPAATDAGGDA